MTTPRNGPTTLLDKIWDRHVVGSVDEHTDLLYVDLHLIHEVSTPQAFDGLRDLGLPVRRPDLTLATLDHSVPTRDRDRPIADEMARAQVARLRDNCAESGIRLHELGTPYQGIVHVIGPELGLTQPGMTIVCGDSHTSTHGAFGALAFGIGTSEVQHVLATQCLPQRRPRTMRVTADGVLPEGTTAKDLILSVIRQIGVGGGAGHVIEYSGSAFRALTMEGRMTVSNMSIEAGARAGLIAPDDTTFEYLHGRRRSPTGPLWAEALDSWRELRSDEGAVFDREVSVDVSSVVPTVTWGTNPAMSVGIDQRVPAPTEMPDPVAAARALEYMGLRGGEAVTGIRIDRVFIGSCTNGRIEDLRAAAAVVQGRRIAAGVSGLVVPGSTMVREQAAREGLDRVFLDAGFEWRDAGCSMCLGMSGDLVAPGERCASTSNRNFEGRQGPGARTHLVSPAMAAGAAIAGHFVDVRQYVS